MPLWQRLVIVGVVLVITLIVAGALAVDGRLSALAIFAVAFTACAISDAAWYAAGRLYGRRVLKLLCQISLSPDSCVQQSQRNHGPCGHTVRLIVPRA